MISEKPSLPLCCSPKAYAILSRQLNCLDSPDALLNGALAIAMHQDHSAKPSEVDATLQGFVDTVRSRVRGDQPQALLAHLHDVLFDEMGFTGNSENYYSPSNSYLPDVLKTRKGLPIALSLIYKIVAERLGLRVRGIGLPGHFLVGVSTGIQSDGEPELMLVDPFAGGRILSKSEAHKRMQAQFGDEIEWSDELLKPVSNRHWLTRMLQNLLNLFGGESRYADVAAVLEMEMLLWPDQQHLQRDLGLVLARCGLSRPASVWLDRYLKGNPDDPQTGELRQLLDVLK